VFFYLIDNKQVVSDLQIRLYVFIFLLKFSSSLPKYVNIGRTPLNRVEQQVGLGRIQVQ